ncbi:MAG: 3-deoxy-7-phosphoheptulonate synthase [Myxococcota bacterium]
MLITLTPSADPKRVQRHLARLGVWCQPLAPLGATTTATTNLLVAPHSAAVDPERVARVDGVSDVRVAKSPHPLVDALAGGRHPIGTVATIGGDAPPVLMAGPCSVESEETARACAEIARRAGAKLLRGGAFKPRTSPYSFNGKGHRALRWLRDAADAEGLGVVTEVMSEHEVEAVAEVADLIQVGSRNMQNFALLHAVGGSERPIMLKRGMAATVDEWLQAGEHCLASGAPVVVFCERGLQSFDPTMRNLFDVSAVALLRHAYRLPVLADPSHAAGRKDLVVPLAHAALAAGAHGLLVEAHPDPAQALSDGPQALDPDQLIALGQKAFAS